MKRNPAPYSGRSHTKKQTPSVKPKLSVAERRARKARKELIKMFPQLASRLQNGLSPGSIYQHAATPPQPGTDNPK